MTLIKTTVFRLSLAFAAVFVLITIGALHYVSNFTIHGIETQAETELFNELTELETHYQESGLDFFVNFVALRDHYGHYLLHYYALVKKGDPYVAGSHFLAGEMPPVEFTRDGVSYFKISNFVTDDNKTRNLRVARLQVADDWYLYAAVSQDFVTQLRHHTWNALISAIVITVLLAVLTGAYMGRSVLARIWRIDRGLRDSINADFKKSLAVPKRDDEFKALTLKLNLALGRVAELLKGMREVTDNVAHDLRSPLTRMRSRLEVALLKERSSEEYREVISQTVEDCSDLLNTFNALLSIAQAECGASPEGLERIDISDAADAMAELYCIVAEERGLQLNWTKPQPLFVNCRRQALAQAISNLLENAIKYTPEGGTVTLSVAQTGQVVTLSVRDTGPGIAEKDRKRVLERFQRLDNARNLPGNGLGLSLVNAVAKLCSAELVMSDNRPGLIVDLRFPAARTPSA